MNDKTEQSLTNEPRGTAAGGHAEIINVPGYPLMVRAVDYNALRAEKDRLAACLKKANINIEHFEYEWYLRGDELDALRAQLAEAQRELVAKEAERAGMKLERNNAQRQHTMQCAINKADSQRILELTAQLAEAQRDAERLDWIIEHRAYVVSDPDSCDGFWLNYARPDGTTWTQATEHETPRAAIDAAKGPA